MKIKSVVLGEIEYSAESIITFKDGLIGMGDKKEFILVEKDDFKPFAYLQSLNDPNLSLIVINPLLVRNKYNFQIQQADFECIDVRNETDISLFTIVVFSEDVSNMTVNMKAPLIINTRSKQGKQTILLNDHYGVAEPLIEKSTVVSYLKQKENIEKKSC
jgi:flagellar assembly factor FliW